MSLTATRSKSPKSALNRFNSADLLERCFEEGIVLDRGFVQDLRIAPSWQITEENVENIPYLSPEEFNVLIENKSWGARWMARRAYLYGKFSHTLDSLRSDLAAYRDISRYLRNNESKCEHLDITPGKLLDLGIRHEWQARRFLELYAATANLDRPWGSCYQVDQRKVLAIATCKNFNKLPLWVKSAMAWSKAVPNTTDRIGDIWRYVPCAKAWKVSPWLSKRIAEKVGKMSFKARLLSAIAYAETLSEGNEFWLALQELLKAPLIDVLERALESYRLGWGKWRISQLISIYLKVPVDSLELQDKPNIKDCLTVIEKHGNPRIVCETLFGCSGKATIAAYAQSKKSSRDWAGQMAWGQPDLIQKYLKSECVDYQSDAIRFLKSLSPNAALRMISTTNYKVRGEVHPVEEYLVRDTGYLWKNIINKPDLGRIRCWLSVHEDLARAFVAEQPDETLPVNSAFEPLDGLVAIDKSWQLVLPRSTQDLKLWGQLLSHCVGGYGPAIKSGRSVIMAVIQGGRPTYTIEYVRSGNYWYCNQFYGVRNSFAPHGLQDEIKWHIEQVLEFR